MEMEALQAILMDDLVLFDGMLPDGWPRESPTYKVTISPYEEGEEGEGDEKLMELLFAHTSTVSEHCMVSLDLAPLRSLPSSSVP